MFFLSQLLGKHAAGYRDRDIGRLSPDLGQRLVTGRRDFALGPITSGLSFRSGRSNDLLTAGLGVLLSPVEDGLDPFVCLGHQAAMLGEKLLALVTNLLGLQQRVLEMLLALVQSL